MNTNIIISLDKLIPPFFDQLIYGTNFLNPLIIIRKGDTIRVVLDARH